METVDVRLQVLGNCGFGGIRAARKPFGSLLCRKMAFSEVGSQLVSLARAEEGSSERWFVERGSRCGKGGALGRPWQQT